MISKSEFEKSTRWDSVVESQDLAPETQRVEFYALAWQDPVLKIQRVGILAQQDNPPFQKTTALRLNALGCGQIPTR